MFYMYPQGLNFILFRYPTNEIFGFPMWYDGEVDIFGKKTWKLESHNSNNPIQYFCDDH